MKVQVKVDLKVELKVENELKVDDIDYDVEINVTWK